LDGGKVANDYADLWDFSILAPINTSERGVVESSGLVWTGTGPVGTASVVSALGRPGLMAVGFKEGGG
jgi:hypothetical protein